MPLVNRQLQAYLEAIASANRPNWLAGSELYTPTQMLSLRAQATQRAASKSDGLGDEPANQSELKVEQVDVLEGLWSYAVEGIPGKNGKSAPDHHVLLIGKPGSGKSMALQQLRRDTAQKALAASRRDNPRIPILIELRGILEHSPKDDAVWTWIQTAIESEINLTLALDTLKQSQNWLLLFDGLNEASFKTLQSLHSFLSHSNALKIPTICTTRQLSAGNDLGIRTHLKMLPLNEQQMREFVQKYLPEHGDMLLGQLQGRLHEIAETPLLLKLLCDVFDTATQQIPQNKSDLFRLFDTQYNSQGNRTYFV